MTETKPNPIDARCAELGITRNVLAARMADQTGRTLGSCLEAIITFALGHSVRATDLAAVARAADCSADLLLGLPVASRDYEKLEGKLQTALRRVQELEATNESIADQLQLTRDDAVALEEERQRALGELDAITETVKDIPGETLLDRIVALRTRNMDLVAKAAGKAHAATVAELEGQLAALRAPSEYTKEMQSYDYDMAATGHENGHGDEYTAQRIAFQRGLAMGRTQQPTPTPIPIPDALKLTDGEQNQLLRKADDGNHTTLIAFVESFIAVRVLKPMTEDEVQDIWLPIDREQGNSSKSRLRLVNACRVGIGASEPKPVLPDCCPECQEPKHKPDGKAGVTLTKDEFAELSRIDVARDTTDPDRAEAAWCDLLRFIDRIKAAAAPVTPGAEMTTEEERRTHGLIIDYGDQRELRNDPASERDHSLLLTHINAMLAARVQPSAVSAARDIAERLVFTLLIYPDYTVESRGPTGCIHDALRHIDREVETMVREQGARFAYAYFWPESDDDELPEPIAVPQQPAGAKLTSEEQTKLLNIAMGCNLHNLDLRDSSRKELLAYVASLRAPLVSEVAAIKDALDNGTSFDLGWKERGMSAPERIKHLVSEVERLRAKNTELAKELCERNAQCAARALADKQASPAEPTEEELTELWRAFHANSGLPFISWQPGLTGLENGQAREQNAFRSVVRAARAGVRVRLRELTDNESANALAEALDVFAKWSATNPEAARQISLSAAIVAISRPFARAVLAAAQATHAEPSDGGQA